MEMDIFKTAIKSLDDLPDVKLLPNNSLGTSAAAIAERMMLDYANKDPYTVFSEIQTEETFKTYFNELSDLCTVLSGNVSGAIRNFKNILTPEVSGLAQNIFDERDSILRNNGAEYLVSETAVPTIDFNIVNFEKLAHEVGSTGSITEYMEKIFGVYNASENKALLSELSFISPKFLDILKLSSNVELTDEALEEIFTKVKVKLPEFEDKLIRDVMTFAITGNTVGAYAASIHSILNEISAFDSRANGIKYAVSFINEVWPIIEELYKLEFDLSDSTKERINANLENARNCGFTIAYILLALNDFYKEKLIIYHGLVNEVELEKFHDEGGTDEDIVYYTRIVMQDGIGSGSAETKAVLDAKQAVGAQIASYNATLKAKMVTLKNESTKQAILVVLNAFVNTNRERISEAHGGNPNSYEMSLRYVESVIGSVLGKDENIEDLLYVFLLKSCYPNTILETVYHKLGAEYMKSVSNSVTDSESDFIFADSVVAGEIILDWVVENFIVPLDN